MCEWMDDRSSRDVVDDGEMMSEERWWSNVDFWRGVCEVAVLYGYHPTYSLDISVVASGFPRGLSRLLLKKIAFINTNDDLRSIFTTGGKHYSKIIITTARR